MKYWILTFSLWFLVLDAQASVRRKTPEIPVQSSRSLRQQIESHTEMLEKEVAKAKNIKERYRSLNRVLNQIKALRENAAPQDSADEAHLDLLVSALESLPGEGKFKKKDCPRYETDFLNQFEPTAEEAPQEPAVKPSWVVLESLCK